MSRTFLSFFQITANYWTTNYANITNLVVGTGQVDPPAGPRHLRDETTGRIRKSARGRFVNRPYAIRSNFRFRFGMQIPKKGVHQGWSRKAHKSV